MPYIEPESIGVRASTKKELEKYRRASDACWDDFLLAMKDMWSCEEAQKAYQESKESKLTNLPNLHL